MADSTDDDILGTELESRLDDLFGADDIAAPEAGEHPPARSYPLAELKNLVFSIDWEITDEVLESFLRQIADLKLTYEHDKIVTAFLQILGSLGAYIKTRRGNAHPRTFKILNAVFASLDKVVLSGDMTEKERKKLLRAAMNSYQKLRMQIAARKSAERQKAAVGRLQPAAKTGAQAPAEDLAEALEPKNAAVEDAASIENLAEAVAQIKAYIHAEIEALKKRIDQLAAGGRDMKP